MTSDREKLIELLEDIGVICDIEDGIDRFTGGRIVDIKGADYVADHLIANGVTFAKDTDVPGKWISVEDEKPKRKDEYFISYKFAGSDMRFYGSAFWHDDIPDNGYIKGDHFSNEGVDGMYVTHWMKIPKLPQPPREE